MSLRRIVGLLSAAALAACSASFASAAAWTTDVASQALARNFEQGVHPAGNGRYWVSFDTYESNHVVARFDAATGAFDRQVDLPGLAVAAMVDGSGGLFVATKSYPYDDLAITHLDSDGRARWSSSLRSGPQQYARFRLFAGGDVLVVMVDQSAGGTGRLRLARLRLADGNLAWSYEATPRCRPDATVLRGERVLVECYDDQGTFSGFRVLAGDTGAAMGNLPLGPGNAPVSVTGTWGDATSDLFAYADGRLLRIDASGGGVRWTSAALLGGNASVFPLDANLIAVALEDGRTVAVRRADGAVAWERALRDLQSDGAGHAYVLGTGGFQDAREISRIDPATGQTLWRIPPDASQSLGFVGSPVAIDSDRVVRVKLVALSPTRLANALESITASGQASAPVVPQVATPGGVSVASANGAMFASRAVSDAQQSRTALSRIDTSNGAVSWERTIASSTAHELAAGGWCVSPGGVVVAVANSQSFADVPPYAVGVAVGLDAATGTERWRREISFPDDDAFLFQPACDADGLVHFSLYRTFSAGSVRPVELLALRASDGTTAWRRESGPSFGFATNASTLQGGGLAGLDVAQGNAQLLASPDGAPIWSTPLSGATGSIYQSQIQRFPGGDALFPWTQGPVASRNLALQRLDRASGAVRWSLRIDGSSGARLALNALSVADNDVLAAMSTGESSSVQRGTLARIDAESGALAWSVDLPRAKNTLTSAANVRVLPSGRIEVRQTEANLDVAQGTRYSLATLDRATGAFRFSRSFGEFTPLDPGPQRVSPGQLEILGDDALVVADTRGFDLPAARRVERRLADATGTGDLAVALRLGAPTSTTPLRIPFRVDARNVGATSVAAASLRTSFPRGAILETAQCRIAGGGRCADRSLVRQLRQQVDLEAGASAIVEGTVVVPFPDAQLEDFVVSFDLPPALGDVAPLDNVAVVRPSLSPAIDLVADQRFSGSWFDPTRSGEGWIVEMLPDGRALLFWFTYPPDGALGDQQWLIAQDGEVQGSRIVFDDVYLTGGTRFGSAFDPSAVRLTRWGEISISLDDCNNGTLEYRGRSPFNGGTRKVTRLTALAGVECSGSTSPPSAIRSGAWYDPQRAGEGWIVEALPDGRATVYWFTYSPDGNQAWTFGTGTLVGDRLRIDDMRRPRGTRFGTAFNPANVNVAPWGTLQIDFSGCNGGALSYTSSEAGYDSASRNITRLTRIAGTECR